MARVQIILKYNVTGWLSKHECVQLLEQLKHSKGHALPVCMHAGVRACVHVCVFIVCVFLSCAWALIKY